ncbi:MAG: sulfur carrier protein ThiS [Campylobacterales bacterium]|nr:sulfur carrier protein ThiS [Campylobacterales bacterium]
MITVSINGERKEIKEGLNIKELIKALGYTTSGFAIAINTTFVPIAKYLETIIKAGDEIDILAPVQGG